MVESTPQSPTETLRDNWLERKLKHETKRPMMAIESTFHKTYGRSALLLQVKDRVDTTNPPQKRFETTGLSEN